jgi:predicted outer membrane protein
VRIQASSATTNSSASNVPGNITVMMSKITIAGEEIEFDAAAVAVSTNKIVKLFAKEKSAALSEEKRQDLFEKITKPKLYV